MDEITTGLDASTAFLVCRCIKNLVRLREVSAACLPAWTAFLVLPWQILQVWRAWNLYGTDQLSHLHESQAPLVLEPAPETGYL